MGQLDQASVEAKTGSEEVASLQRQIAVYQRRLESTPRREHELTLITRDYETTRDLFRSLLAKRDEAGIAANLEQRQKGEIFRIMDAAVTPDRPAGPNRLRLLLIGFVLAVTVSGAAVILAESADTSFRSVDEVRSRIAVPILSTIPKITTESDRFRLRRQRQLATAVMAVGLVVVLGSSFVIAHNNKELVDMLSVDTTSAKR